jgi:hypothetical protein
MAEVVFLAGRCADIFVEKSAMWSIADVRHLCTAWFKVSEIDCDSLLVEIGQKTRELAPLFDIQIDSERTYESILQRANESLLEMTRLAEDAGPASERRRAPRIQRSANATLLTCNGGVVGQALTVRLRDLSARGMGFTYAKPLPVGTQFVVKVPLQNGQPTTLLYNVVRCHPAADQAGPTAGPAFDIGAELLCVVRNDSPAIPRPGDRITLPQGQQPSLS